MACARGDSNRFTYACCARKHNGARTSEPGILEDLVEQGNRHRPLRWNVARLVRHNITSTDVDPPVFCDPDLYEEDDWVVEIELGYFYPFDQPPKEA